MKYLISIMIIAVPIMLYIDWENRQQELKDQCPWIYQEQICYIKHWDILYSVRNIHQLNRVLTHIELINKLW